MMEDKKPVDFEAEDFAANQSFVNYHLQNNRTDELIWKEWLTKHPHKKAAADEAKLLLDMLFLRLPASEYLQELSKMQAKLQEEAIIPARATVLMRLLSWNKAATNRKRKRIKILAAVIPILIVLSGALYFLRVPPVASNEALLLKINAATVPLSFVLSDNTVVTLGANSTLKYPAVFSANSRTVYLEGEAGFSVTKNAKQPFKVHSGGLISTVLGTVFNIKNQHGDSVVLVELLEGKLQVQQLESDGSIVLQPNERLVYTRYSNSMFKQNWLPAPEKSKTELQHLTFNKNSFEEIAAKIKLSFGVTLINRSGSNNWRFTGEFKNSSAKDIIENICLIKQLRYELHNDTIVIK